MAPRMAGWVRPLAACLLLLATAGLATAVGAAGADVTAGSGSRAATLPAGARDTHVSSGAALAAAIRDPTVSRIIVDSDIRFEPSDWPSGPAYKLSRNLTISSDPSGPHRVIDFNAREVINRLSIAPGTNLSLIHLTVKDTRYGAGADIDILAPSPDGILYLHDLAKLQTSCAPLVKKNILAYMRDPSVPGVNDIVFPPTVVWDGVTYSGPIQYRDFSTRMAVGENVAVAGYVVHKRGSLKLCAKVADAECLAQHDAPTCVRMDQDQDYRAHHAPPRPAGLPAAAAAGTAVGAGAAAAAAAAAALILARRRRREREAAAAAAPPGVKLIGCDLELGDGCGPAALKKGPAGPGSSPPASPLLCSALYPNSGSSRGSSASAASGAGTASTAGFSSGGGGSSRTSASLPEVLGGTMTREQATSVQLGSLVGAGSFGRVFRGLFGSPPREVAIKVVHHQRDAARQVAHEVEVAMGMDHPNVARAHAFVTWGAAGVSRLTRPEMNDDSAANLIGCSFSNMVVAPGVFESGEGAARLVAGAGRAGRRQPMVETWIVMDYANGGNLQDAVMDGSQGPFFDADGVPQMGLILQVLHGVACGMECVHSRNVLHGDLKSANVLLDVTSSQSGGAAGPVHPALAPADGGEPGALAAAVAGGSVELTPKVTDFGISRTITAGMTHLSTHTVGTITHQAPELIATGRLSRPADVFSFGVMMWEVVEADAPWRGKMMGEVVAAVVVEGRRLPFGPAAPQAYVDLAMRCMAADPAARPDFAAVAAALEGLMAQQAQLQAEAAAGAVAAAAAAAATTAAAEGSEPDPSAYD